MGQPFTYLDGSDENIYAMRNLGDQFSNTLLGLARLRASQEALAQQRAMEAARFALERQRSERESMLFPEQLKKEQLANEAVRNTIGNSQRFGRLMGTRNAPNIMQLVQDPATAQTLFGDLRTAGVVPQGEFQMSQSDLIAAINAAAQGSAATEAATSPGAMAQMLQPDRLSRGETAFNRFTMRPEYTVPMMPTPNEVAMQDYRNRSLAQTMARDKELADWHDYVQRYQTSQTDEEIRHNKAVEAKVSGDPLHAELAEDLRVQREARSRTNNITPSVTGTANVLVDRQGRKWRYKGKNPNPKLDTNPSNWEEIR